MALPTARDIPSYDEDVDFEALARDDPDFAEVYDATHHKIDFQDPKSVQYDNLEVPRVMVIAQYLQAIDQEPTETRLWPEARAA